MDETTEALSFSTDMEATTKMSGLWIDPVTRISGHLKRSTPATVRQAVRMLTGKVISKVNDAYSFVPPLSPLQRDDMVVDYYTGKLNLLYFLFF